MNVSDPESLHRDDSKPVTTGTDVSAVVASVVTGAETDSADSTKSGNDWFDDRIGILPAFKVYWDISSKSYKVNDPVVICPDGTRIVASVPDSIEGGDWFCKVTGNDSSYTAEITDTVDDEDKTSRYFPIFSVDYTTGDVIQHHVGILVLSSSGVSSIVGNAEGSERITGDVEITGMTDPDKPDTTCGLDFLTVSAREEEGRPPRIVAVLKRYGVPCTTSSNLGLHQIEYTDKTTKSRVIAHVFACGDINIAEPGGGGGGGDDSDSDSGSGSSDWTYVVTGFDSLSIDTEGKFLLKYYKRKVKVFREEEEEGTASLKMAATRKTVVTHSSYADGKFVNKTVSALLLESSDSTSDDVFTAAPHSDY